MCIPQPKHTIELRRPVLATLAPTGYAYLRAKVKWKLLSSRKPREDFLLTFKANYLLSIQAVY